MFWFFKEIYGIVSSIFKSYYLVLGEEWKEERWQQPRLPRLFLLLLLILVFPILRPPLHNLPPNDLPLPPMRPTITAAVLFSALIFVLAMPQFSVAEVGGGAGPGASQRQKCAGANSDC